MARRVSRAKKRKFCLIGVSSLLICGCIVVAYVINIRQIETKYAMKEYALLNQIHENQRVVYRAKTEIPAGTKVDENNTELITVPSNMNANFYMDESDFGKISVVDIAASQDIYSNMLGTADIFSLRECEYSVLTLNNNLQANDFVDIRIMYPNGENYTVLSKKCIKSISHSSNEVFFWLDESDIMNMSSAIVDIYMHTGSILYTTKYIEDGQDSIKVNYQPSMDVMTAIANDPNIVDRAALELTERMNANLRSSLETRLGKFNEDKNISTSSSVDLTNTVTNGAGSEFSGDDVETGDDSTSNTETESSNDTDKGEFSFNG